MAEVPSAMRQAKSQRNRGILAGDRIRSPFGTTF